MNKTQYFNLLVSSVDDNTTFEATVSDSNSFNELLDESDIFLFGYGENEIKRIINKKEVVEGNYLFLEYKNVSKTFYLENPKKEKVIEKFIFFVDADQNERVLHCRTPIFSAIVVEQYDNRIGLTSESFTHKGNLVKFLVDWRIQSATESKISYVLKRAVKKVLSKENIFNAV